MPFKHLGAVAMLAAGACLPWAASRADEGERARVVQQVAHAVVRSWGRISEDRKSVV